VSAEFEEVSGQNNVAKIHPLNNETKGKQISLFKDHNLQFSFNLGPREGRSETARDSSDHGFREVICLELGALANHDTG